MECPETVASKSTESVCNNGNTDQQDAISPDEKAESNMGSKTVETSETSEKLDSFNTKTELPLLNFQWVHILGYFVNYLDLWFGNRFSKDQDSSAESDTARSKDLRLDSSKETPQLKRSVFLLLLSFAINWQVLPRVLSHFRRRRLMWLAGWHFNGRGSLENSPISDGNAHLYNLAAYSLVLDAEFGYSLAFMFVSGVLVEKSYRVSQEAWRYEMKMRNGLGSFKERKSVILCFCVSFLALGLLLVSFSVVLYDLVMAIRETMAIEKTRVLVGK